jgi:hypothetical protein
VCHDRRVAVVDRLVQVYASATGPVRAVAMRAYMRDQFPFLGIPTPARRGLSREVLAGVPAPDEATLREVALACWELPAREYQYFACDYLTRYADRCTPAMLPTLERLLTTRSWWDTVDPLAGTVAGAVVLAYPPEVSTMDSWLGAGDMWLVRGARCASTRGPTRRQYALSWPRTVTNCPRSRFGRRQRTSSWANTSDIIPGRGTLRYPER